MSSTSATTPPAHIAYQVNSPSEEGFAAYVHRVIGPEILQWEEARTDLVADYVLRKNIASSGSIILLLLAYFTDNGPLAGGYASFWEVVEGWNVTFLTWKNTWPTWLAAIVPDQLIHLHSPSPYIIALVFSVILWIWALSLRKEYQPLERHLVGQHILNYFGSFKPAILADIVAAPELYQMIAFSEFSRAKERLCFSGTIKGAEVGFAELVMQHEIVDPTRKKSSVEFDDTFSGVVITIDFRPVIDEWQIPDLSLIDNPEGLTSRPHEDEELLTIPRYDGLKAEPFGDKITLFCANPSKEIHRLFPRVVVERLLQVLERSERAYERSLSDEERLGGALQNAWQQNRIQEEKIVDLYLFTNYYIQVSYHLGVCYLRIPHACPLLTKASMAEAYSPEEEIRTIYTMMTLVESLIDTTLAYHKG
jgi:hypothetical protein